MSSCSKIALRLIFLFAIMIFWGTFVFCQEAPKFKFLDSRVINVPSIRAGETYNISVRYKNEGNQTLVIKKVNKTCNCTKAVVQHKILEPGASGQVDITIDTEGKRGQNTIVITLATNAKPASSIIRINLNVIP